MHLVDGLADGLHKHVGLEGVAKGVRIYQDAIRDHCHPKNAYKSTAWLTSLESMDLRSDGPIDEFDEG